MSFLYATDKLHLATRTILFSTGVPSQSMLNWANNSVFDTPLENRHSRSLALTANLTARSFASSCA